MTKDNTHDPSKKTGSDALHDALMRVPFAHEIVAHELRLMAAGEYPYRRFAYMSPSVKSLWRAAADLLDPPVRKSRK